LEIGLSAGIKDYTFPGKHGKVHFKFRYNQTARETVIFIHGLACSLDSFRNLFDFTYYLSDKNLLLIDLIGFGKSTKKPSGFSYKMEEHASVVDELLTSLPSWDYHIVAHSLGGAVALLLPERVFERTLTFTNIEGNLISDDCGALSRGVTSLSFKDYENVLFHTQLKEFAGHHQLRFEESTAEAVYQSAISLVEWSDSGKLLPMFENLRCRKSYFYGEENKAMPILDRITFAEKFMVPNSGHGLMTENSNEFYNSLQKFINDN
jgi:pimeloyl-ACP methyl ester carboxylesterase